MIGKSPCLNGKSMRPTLGNYFGGGVGSKIFFLK